jgi:hypothetical protein
VAIHRTRAEPGREQKTVGRSKLVATVVQTVVALCVGVGVALALDDVVMGVAVGAVLFAATSRIVRSAARRDR